MATLNYTEGTGGPVYRVGVSAGSEEEAVEFAKSVVGLPSVLPCDVVAEGDGEFVVSFETADLA